MVDFIQKKCCHCFKQIELNSGDRSYIVKWYDARIEYKFFTCKTINILMFSLCIYSTGEM